jgi:virginiamycin B lyase
MKRSTLVIVLLAVVGFAQTAAAAADAALAGLVTSAEEGAMEGVVVSAHRQGSSVTVSVVSDHDGHYGFPASRLVPGHYLLDIRADGYELDGAGVVDLAKDKMTVTNLTLRKTKNLAAQLNDAEWLASMPGTDTQKKFLLNCNECHSLQRIVESTHTADEFLQVFQRMAGWCPCSTSMRPQKLKAPRAMPPLGNLAGAAGYLASINLSNAETWDYPLKTLPRPTGRATHVIITEFALPRATMEPHDVVVDKDGIVWFSEFGDMALGRLDPKTGKVSEYPIPRVKSDAPPGELNLELGTNDDLWIGMQFQASFAHFDKKTKKVAVFSVPNAWNTDSSQVGFVSAASSMADGKVWFKNANPNSFFRLDLATKAIESIGTPTNPATGKPVGAYGIPVDAENNVYLLDFGSDTVGRIDAKTLQVSVWHTPTAASRPRRGRFDDAGHLWFAEYGANTVGMFDPKAAQFREYAMPTPWTSPYDVTADKNGEVWTASMFTDRVVRLDPKTGSTTEYPLPEPVTNIRRVFVDNSTSPVTFWAGSNHNAGILKVEPLD